MFQSIRHEQIENKYNIGGWRWQLLESVKALHEIDDLPVKKSKLTLIRDLQEAANDQEIVVAVKRYRYAVENYRNPEYFGSPECIAA